MPETGKEQPLVNCDLDWSFATTGHHHQCRLSINSINQEAAEHTWAENGSRWKSLIGFQFHYPIIPPLIPPIYRHYTIICSQNGLEAIPTRKQFYFYISFFPWGWLLCYVAFHIDQYWTHLATPVVSSPQPARRWQPILLAVQMQQPERGEKVLPAMGIPIRNIRNKHEQTTYRNIWVCNGYTYITSLNQLTLYNIPSGSRRYKVYMGIQGFEDCPGIKEMDKPCLTKNVGFLTTRMGWKPTATKENCQEFSWMSIADHHDKTLKTETVFETTNPLDITWCQTHTGERLRLEDLMKPWVWGHRSSDTIHPQKEGS